MRKFLIFTMAIFVMGCVIAGKPTNGKSNDLIDALIVGSAESPDPVLERVKMLEINGIVKDVVIFESFPVQIHLKATNEVIEKLNNIPRVGNKLY